MNISDLYWSVYCNSNDIKKGNGNEFNNETLGNYWKQNNTKYLNGGPYQPQHQGAVKVFNWTVQNFLVITKDHKKQVLLRWVHIWLAHLLQW